jgi:hypothetical protein
LNNILPEFTDDELRQLYTLFRKSKHRSRGNSRGSYTYKNKEKYNPIDDKKIQNKIDGDKIKGDFDKYIKAYGSTLKAYNDARYGFLGLLADKSDTTKSHFIEFMLTRAKKTIYDAYWSDYDVKKFTGYYPCLVQLFKDYLINNRASNIDIVGNANYILQNKGKIDFFAGEYENNSNIKSIERYLKGLIKEYGKAVIGKSNDGSSASAVSSR